jgi:hypothetical protein
VRLLFYDVETSPNVTWTWGLFNQNIGINQVIEPSRIICFSARWEDSPDCMYFSEHDMSHDDMIRKAHELFSEADFIAGYNNKNFDDQHMAREFLLLHLPPVHPKSIDLYRISKRRFKFTSGKLEWIAGQLGLQGGKEKHHKYPGFELWKECLANNADAWREMEVYSRQDTNLLLDLWKELKPWAPATMVPNVALVDGIVDPVCPSCGGSDYRAKGWVYLATGAYHRYQCKAEGCGRYFRSRTRSLAAEFRTTNE